MLIRARRDEDLEPCARLLRDVYEHDAYPANWPRDPAGWIAGRHTLAAWVSEDAGQVVGHVALTEPAPDRSWPEWQRALNCSPERLAVVRRLFVAPGSRRRGVARALLEHVGREAGARGRQLVLDVAEHNRAAIAFWHEQGWRPVGQATLPPGDEGRPLRLVLFVRPARDPDRAGSARDSKLSERVDLLHPAKGASWELPTT